MVLVWNRLEKCIRSALGNARQSPRLSTGQATLALGRQQKAAAGTVTDTGELIEIASTALSSKSFVTIRVPGDISLEEC